MAVTHRINGEGAERSEWATESLRVLLVDDDAVFRRGLRHLLSGDGIDVVGEVWTGDAAVLRAAELLPDVVLLGLSADGPRELETLRRIRAIAPDVPVVVLAVSRDPADLLAAITADTRGFVTKDAGIEEIVAGLRSASAGGIYLSPAMMPGLLNQVRAMIDAAPASAPTQLLSKRENQVLSLMAHGMENGEIAVRLTISVGTVKAHVSHILYKLGVENRVQAAVMASRTRDAAEPMLVSVG